MAWIPILSPHLASCGTLSVLSCHPASGFFSSEMKYITTATPHAVLLQGLNEVPYKNPFQNAI